MENRRDALAAAAEVILEVERLGREQTDVASVGHLHVEPNRVGVIAAEAQLTADIRAWDDQAVDEGVAALAAAAAATCERRGVQYSAEVITRAPTVRFPEEVVSAVVDSAESVGQHPLRLASAANHDASNLATLCPTGMVFVPSLDGRSHSPDEQTSDSECELGTTVLAITAITLAGSSGSDDELDPSLG
jgi:acetylornithine deacetylase/succinyl-diaminopimelate desuccinylase-like protein